MLHLTQTILRFQLQDEDIEDSPIFSLFKQDDISGQKLQQRSRLRLHCFPCKRSSKALWGTYFVCADFFWDCDWCDIFTSSKGTNTRGKVQYLYTYFWEGMASLRAGQRFWSNNFGWDCTGCPFSLLKTSHWPGIADGCLRNSGGSYLVCSKIWVTFFMWALFMFRGRQFIANWLNT